MDTWLADATWRGAKERYGKPSREVKAQIRRELDLIGRLGFSGYFLIVWDLVNFCRDNEILVQGRGSAANSAVCFCLGITPVDPVFGVVPHKVRWLWALGAFIAAVIVGALLRAAARGL